jgi:hypothetical protein
MRVKPCGARVRENARAPTPHGKPTGGFTLRTWNHSRGRHTYEGRRTSMGEPAVNIRRAGSKRSPMRAGRVRLLAQVHDQESAIGLPLSTFRGFRARQRVKMRPHVRSASYRVSGCRRTPVGHPRRAPLISRRCGFTASPVRSLCSPFANLSDDPAAGVYFSRDGMVEEIITTLSRILAPVRDRTQPPLGRSPYKGRPIRWFIYFSGGRVPVARELGIRYVLQGFGCRMSGNRPAHHAAQLADRDEPCASCGPDRFEAVRWKTSSSFKNKIAIGVAGRHRADAAPPRRDRTGARRHAPRKASLRNDLVLRGSSRSPAPRYRS